jgi:hypothetical protein
MVDRLKLHEKPRIRCRYSGGAFEPESRCFAGLHRNQSTGPRLKTCRGDVIRPPIRVKNMKRANAPAALSGPRFSRPRALPEVSDSSWFYRFATNGEQGETKFMNPSVPKLLNPLIP